MLNIFALLQIIYQMREGVGTFMQSWSICLQLKWLYRVFFATQFPALDKEVRHSGHAPTIKYFLRGRSANETISVKKPVYGYKFPVIIKCFYENVWLKKHQTSLLYTGLTSTYFQLWKYTHLSTVFPLRIWSF